MTGYSDDESVELNSSLRSSSADKVAFPGAMEVGDSDALVASLAESVELMSLPKTLSFGRRGRSSRLGDW